MKQDFAYAKPGSIMTMTISRLEVSAAPRYDLEVLSWIDGTMIGMTKEAAKETTRKAAQRAPKLTFVVRDCADVDMVEIRDIYAHHVRTGLASFEEEAPGLEEMRRRRGEVLKLGLPYLVAESEDGQILGYAYATPYRARSAYRFAIENSVYVQGGMAGRGIGSALLSALIARCESGPWRQMIAIIGNSGNAASIALHSAHGFRMVGTLRGVGFKHGDWVDTVLMQRELGVGAGALPDNPAS
jgi:L-amino acid N-acyltransferase YncA